MAGIAIAVKLPAVRVLAAMAPAQSLASFWVATGAVWQA